MPLTLIGNTSVREPSESKDSVNPLKGILDS